MSRICPIDGKKTIYLTCQECEDKVCENSKDDTFYLLIAGTRTYTDYAEFVGICDYMLSGTAHPVCIVSGGANGADALAERYAKEKNYQLKVFPAKWDTYGRQAGYIRNKEMHDFIKFHEKRACLCFWNGSSRGTAMNFELAKKDSTRLVVWNYKTKKWMRENGSQGTNGQGKN